MERSRRLVLQDRKAGRRGQGHVRAGNDIVEELAEARVDRRAVRWPLFALVLPCQAHEASTFGLPPPGISTLLKTLTVRRRWITRIAPEASVGRFETLTLLPVGSILTIGVPLIPTFQEPA